MGHCLCSGRRFESCMHRFKYKYMDNKIIRLKRKIDDLEYENFELKQKIKISKENELKEFLQELYNSIT